MESENDIESNINDENQNNNSNSDLYQKDIEINIDYETWYKKDPAIKGRIIDLKFRIDNIVEEQKTLAADILELAKQLNESNLCETDKISITIKEILKEKIQQGKISEKWIEECLPPEYKRKYEKRKEVSSLSKKKKIEDKKIMITADGISVNDGNIADSDSTIKLNDNLSNPLKTDDLSENSTNEDGCSLCKPIYEKNMELEEALKSISLQTADKVKSIKFKIPKVRQVEINAEFNKCKEEVIVECHGYDKIVSIKADIFKENDSQQSNSSISNDQYNNNHVSNDDYTY